MRSIEELSSKEDAAESKSVKDISSYPVFVCSLEPTEAIVFGWASVKAFLDTGCQFKLLSDHVAQSLRARVRLSRVSLLGRMVLF